LKSVDCFVVVDGVAVNNILAMTDLGQFFTHEKSTHSMPHTAKNDVLKITKPM